MSTTLEANQVRLGLASVDREAAIDAAGSHLAELGLVDEAYVPTMHAREGSIGTYMGNGVAMPHGTVDGKASVKGTGIVVHQYPDGASWGDETVHLVIGLAANSDDHVALLSQLAEVLMDEDVCEHLWSVNDVTEVLEALNP